MMSSSRARANVKRADQRYMGRDAPPEDVEVVGARGSTLQGADGRRYVDFTAGWCVGNLGWDVREIRARLRRFKGPDYVHPSHLYGPWTELARQLADITPGRLQRSYRATGGTEAVEIALQLAMAATGRSKLRKRGLMLSVDDDTLTLFPALTISRSVVHEGLDILERCL